ncbi:hypothetical protein VNO78_03725 [Psophocarpus tetragonolobus]|uniref:At1g61320/AtMIF1 LRR domain-containing protein n=1 Tax=Psophocarpus tetragonolobus TaxID=3891 RepID=A0AAN9T4M8_PSOTE
MAQICGSKRSRRRRQSPSVFQNLPPEMLDHIFSLLPIKEAARQCVLASRFRMSKHFNRKFLFGGEFKGRSRDFVTQLIDDLLDTHKGPQIDSFQLRIDPLGLQHFLDKWLQICLRKNIKHLDLHFNHPHYTLTADFLNHLNQLTTLRLIHCNLHLPLELHSMANLTTLLLCHVSLTDAPFHTLLHRCTKLGTIHLNNCPGLSSLHIHSTCLKVLKLVHCIKLEVVAVHCPTLRSLHYSGHVPRVITFAGATHIDEAFLDFAPAGNRRYMQASLLEKLLSHIPNVTLLTASALIPEALTAKFRRGVFGEPCYSFFNLQELHLIMEGGLFCNPYDVLTFMKHCPLLHKLLIDMDDYNFDCGPYWELHQKPKLDKFDHYFDRLKFVKLKGFKFLQSELELVKIILKKATHLEALIFVGAKNGYTKFWRVNSSKYEQLFSYWKASPAARIVLLRHTSDRSGVLPSHSKDLLLLTN